MLLTVISVLVILIIVIILRIIFVKVSNEDIEKMKTEFTTLLKLDIILYKIFGGLYFKFRKKYKVLFEEIFVDFGFFILMKVIPLIILILIFFATLIVTMKYCAGVTVR